ncbi:MGMT family protein [Paludibacterium yongneupense]|uniref:MGMT family protein n=1 Tax=Paludibacterium yongneupense TaxID=400061 RepID=UPI00041D6986|nr:MGMT family protein [Paludibacterium yongneupense]
MATTNPMHAAICRIVAAIPDGRVMSYGAVARAAGFPRHARHVAHALRLCPDPLPWFRVVNHRGGIAARGLNGEDDLQRALLEAEGVVFDASGHIDLARYGWPGL